MAEVADQANPRRGGLVPANERAIEDPEVQKLYANGFGLGMTNADTFIVLQAYGRPVAVVTMSFTLAKTLAQKLNALVTDWEQKTGQTLQTTEAIQRVFRQESEK